MLVCKYCSRELARPSGLVIHQKACQKNPDRVPGQNNYTKGAVCSDETRRKLREAGKRRSPSLETRAKISRSRIEYLKQNPDKVPYLLNHHSKGESFPESYWRKILADANVRFEQEKQVSIYRLDFAINETLDLEIDGEQHYLDPRILASNQRRDEELRSLGWKVLRVRWSDFQRMQEADRRAYVDMVLSHCV